MSDGDPAKPPATNPTDWVDQSPRTRHDQADEQPMTLRKAINHSRSSFSASC